MLLGDSGVLYFRYISQVCVSCETGHHMVTIFAIENGVTCLSRYSL